MGKVCGGEQVFAFIGRERVDAVERIFTFGGACIDAAVNAARDAPIRMQEIHLVARNEEIDDILCGGLLPEEEVRAVDKGGFLAGVRPRTACAETSSTYKFPPSRVKLVICF